MPAKDSSKKNKKAHIIEAAVVSLAFLGTLTACLLYFFRPKENATEAYVLLKGELIHRLSLQEEKELKVNTDIGILEIHVHDGSIGVASSPCGSQYCVHQGYKSKAGDSIVCAPAGLSILLEAGEKQEIII